MRTSQKKFWEVLAAKRGDWRITKDGCIRREVRGSCQVCPVCDVANKITGTLRFGSDYIKAAKAIGLEKNFATRMAHAADDFPSSPDVYKVRDKLIETLKL